MPSTLDAGLSLVATLDAEELEEKLLAAMSAAADAQGAAVWISEDKGELVLRALRGVVDREALPPRLDPRASALGAALLRGEAFEPGGFRLGEALLVPLVADAEALGMVLLERSPRGAFGREQRSAAVELARYAAVAVRNARRVRALGPVGRGDGEAPAAADAGAFLEHAGKELHRSRRHGRSFSVAVVTLDDVEGLGREAGADAALAAARGAVSAVSRVVRDADVLARFSDVEHRVLLPETDHPGALVFQRRAREEIRRDPALRALGERAIRHVSLGAATFPRDGRDLEALLQTCRKRQAERRSSMLVHAAKRLDAATSFWDLADALLEDAPIPPGSPSVRLPLDPELLEATEREAAREIGRDPRARGVLYLAHPGGGGQAIAALPHLEAAARRGDTGTRVYVLSAGAGAPASAQREHPLVARVAVDGDPRLEARAFLLLSSERATYALLQGADGRLFHTSDAPLVDALVAKLQAQYDVQPPHPQAGFLAQDPRRPRDGEEAVARIGELLRRTEGARAPAGGSGLQGSLAQIQLADLLQMLAMNRKTGRLELASDRVRAEVTLADGRVVDASAGPIRGEKALFRLLSWRDGRFAFASGEVPGRGRIERRVEELVLEGLRQCDEAADLLPSLPAPDERLGLAVPSAAVPQDLHPVTAEVVALLARPRGLQDLLDGASATDLEVLRALAALLECGYARREPRPQGADPPALLDARELRALRRQVEPTPGRNGTAIGKVILAGGGPLARRSALVRFGALPGFSAEAEGAPVEFGTLGRLRLGDGVAVDLVAVPSDPALAPLWRPFATGAVAVLVVLPSDGIAARVAALSGELRLPVGVCGPSEEGVEAALREAPAGYAYLGADPVEALRALLALAARGD